MQKLLTVFLILAFSQPLFADTITKEFTAEPGKKLTIDSQVGGSIEVKGWANDKIVLKISTDKDSEDFDMRFITTNGNLKVEVRKGNQKWKNWNGDVDFTVSVPNEFDVELHTMGGHINLTGVEGNLAAKTMGGPLKFQDLKGNLQASTMGGEILVTDSDVDGKVSTMGGNIKFKNVQGEINGKTMGGQVIYDNYNYTADKSSTNSISRGPSEVKISSMGGAINVSDAPNGADVHTMGGNIKIGSVKKFLKAETKGGKIHVGSAEGPVEVTTFGGTITIESSEGPVEAKTFAGDITVTSNGNGDIELTSYSGDIELNIPQNMNIDIDIELAYTKNARETYRIESDFEVKMEKTDEWVKEKNSHSPRKYMYAKGKNGSGKYNIIIRTINGNVFLNEK